MDPFWYSATEFYLKVHFSDFRQDLHSQFTTQRINKLQCIAGLSLEWRKIEGAEFKIFTRFWMTFWWLFKVGKSRSTIIFANIHKGFETIIYCCLQNRAPEIFSKSNARMRNAFLPRRFLHVHLGYVTEMNWPRKPEKMQHTDKTKIVTDTESNIQLLSF